MNISLLALLYSFLSYAVIYEKDDRKEISHFPELREEARAVAIATPTLFLKNNHALWDISQVELLSGSSVYACEDERFSSQPIVGNCTGFLVDKKTILTAGHCVLPNGIVDNDDRHPFCQSFSWYFDYNLKNNRTKTSGIPADQIYFCRKIRRAENIQLPGRSSENFGNDFAVIELDREVEGITPLVLSENNIQKDQEAFSIGHPSGLPAKHSGVSKVLKASNNHYVEINLDTQGGNSGSPVFDLNHTVIGILVSGHPIDYYQDAKGCYRANVCDGSGKNCVENSPFDYLQVSNYVQRLNAVRPYLSKK